GKADGGRPRREDRAQELRHERARPGPPAARVERSLVDGDDHRRRARPAPRHQALVGIEDGVAQGAERRRLEADEQAEREEQGDARRARAGAESQSSISRPSCAAETRSACLPRVSSSRRCASRSAVSMAASLFAGSWWKSTRCFTRASWHSSTPTTLLEWPQSSLTEIASASEYMASKMTRSAARKKPTIASVCARSSGLCSESVL